MSVVADALQRRGLRRRPLQMDTGPGGGDSTPSPLRTSVASLLRASLGGSLLRLCAEDSRALLRETVLGDPPLPFSEGFRARAKKDASPPKDGLPKDFLSGALVRVEGVVVSVYRQSRGRSSFSSSSSSPCHRLWAGTHSALAQPAEVAVETVEAFDIDDGTGVLRCVWRRAFVDGDSFPLSCESSSARLLPGCYAVAEGKVRRRRPGSLRGFFLAVQRAFLERDSNAEALGFASRFTQLQARLPSEALTTPSTCVVTSSPRTPT